MIGWLLWKIFQCLLLFMMIQYTRFICETTFTTYNTLMAQWLPESLVSIVLSFGKCNASKKAFHMLQRKEMIQKHFQKININTLLKERSVIEKVGVDLSALYNQADVDASSAFCWCWCTKGIAGHPWHEQGVIAIVESHCYCMKFFCARVSCVMPYLSC